MSNTKLNSSRRDFLKTASVVGLGSVLTTDPVVRFLAAQMEIPALKLLQISYTCELFRQSDMLHLKYFFFNAKKKGNSLLAFNNKFPLFIYVQVPPQHIAEELVRQKITTWNDFKIKNSFLASSTRLGFAMNAGVNRLMLNAESLLNWNENFHLITIDDFAFKNGENTRAGYKAALDDLADKFENLGEFVLSAHKNRVSFSDHEWPLTKFELPYKMYLSPIAEPAEQKGDEFLRQIGEHIFKHKNDPVIEYEDRTGELKIVHPWENELVFRNFIEADKPPRFKVVNWKGQDSDDGDDCSIFLPAPVHRKELKGLTMRPEFDRDIVSDLFRISAIGGTANLKYKNDDPGNNFSIVAWQQKVKYARDNYVSITYRAIDVFTGIKLLVSVISDRKFKFGVSHLLELYYVTYAEPEKVYTEPIVVSSVPFLKVIPKSTGAFFTPQNVPGSPTSYLVAVDGGLSGTTVDCSKLLSFDYIGVDKAGKEHSFQSKIIFIPAESYVITEGVYNFNPPGEIPISYGVNEPVPLQHIGFLNPRFQTEFKINETEKTERTKHLTTCGQEEDKYKFKLLKLFRDTPASKLTLQKTLLVVNDHVTINVSCYKHKIDSQITYARLTRLKVDSSGSGLGGNSAIRKDSTNATFNTKELLLLATTNDELYSDSGRDNYLQNNPLRVVMTYSDVIVPQIDQMAGKSEFVRVAFYHQYLNGKREIDEDFDANKVKLLFKLEHKIADFFSDNYRSAGAMVNPGIDISHISVLEQTIAYNDLHNTTESHLVKMDNQKVEGVQSTTIFGNMKAEILGMSLTQIMQEFLPVQDLPVFNYLQQAEQSVQRITEIAREFKTLANKWIGEYHEVKSTLETAAQQLKNLDEKIKQALESDARAWLEGMVEQAITSTFYQAAQTLNVLNFADYKNNILNKINDKIIGHFGLSQIPEKMAAIVAATEKKYAAELLFEEILKSNAEPKHLKEVVKFYLISNATEKVRENLEEVIILKGTINAKYQLYFNAFNEGYKEGTLYVEKFVKKQLDTIEAQIFAQTANANAYLTRIFGQDWEPKIKTIVEFHTLINRYSSYAKIYSDLKKEHYEALARELDVAIDIQHITNLERPLIEALRQTILGTPTLPQLSRIKIIFVDKLNSSKQWLRNYELLYEKEFKLAIEEEIKFYKNILNDLNSAHENDVKELLRLKTTINFAERRLQNFVQAKVEEAKAEIKLKLKALEGETRGTQQYKDLQAAISELQLLIHKIQEISKQRLEYSYSTEKFRRVSLGGVIDFVPRNTQLTVNVAYEIEFNISNFDRPPSIARQSFRTDSTLTDFKIGLLQLLFIDFERVQFISGSEVKDDFRVVIRDIQFAGSLSFVQAFQEFLTTISDNLVFDISSAGARIGYSFAIPDFSAGYFNFFNLSLGALLTLPFDPKQAMQIHFGIGTELNKFGLTVSGIFGGQGYFNIIAEPRRGIVGMEIVLEFGAIFNLNLTVARGTAYLVGGIYIKRYDGNYEIRGYILCVGRLNILGIFSASLSFYLGLEGNSHVLYGRCIVTASKRFSRFFEISVQCEMEKQLKGAKSDNTSTDPNGPNSLFTSDELTKLAGASVVVLDTNLNKAHFYGDEEVHLLLLTNDGSGIRGALTLPDEVSSKQFGVKISKNEGYEGSLAFVDIDLSKFNASGKYELTIYQHNSPLFSRPFVLSAGRSAVCTINGLKKPDVSSEVYYRSYYYKNGN